MSFSCISCGKELKLLSQPYEGEFACIHCKEKMYIKAALLQGIEIQRVFPTLEELNIVWAKLNPIEQSTLRESTKSFGVGAYTASEFMSARSLEGILRRVYNKKEMLGKLIERMENDSDLKGLGGIFSYFKDVRNRIAHPEEVSTKLDAESTFSTTKRLILEVFKKKGLI